MNFKNIVFSLYLSNFKIMCEAIRTNTTSISFEEQLTRELFENRGYNTKVRPVSFGSDYLRVNFSLALIQITDLNVKDKESVLAVWIYFQCWCVLIFRELFSRTQRFSECF